MPIAEDIQKLDPSARIELFELDLTQISRSSADKYYFHTGTNQLNGDVVWKGQTYTRYPVEADGFEMNAKGTLPRPTLKVSNVSGIMTALDAAYDGLVGAKVTRRRTLARYLDAANFPARRNQLDRTQDMLWPGWSRVNVTQNTAYLGPDGEMSAGKQEDTAVSSTHYISRSPTATAAAAGEVWTFSTSVKEGEYRYAQVRFFSSAALATTAYVHVDLMDGKIYFSSGVTGTATVTPQGNGWWRVSLSATTSAAGVLSVGVVTMNTSTSNTYLGVVGRGIYTAQWQLEKASTATAYQKIDASFSANPYADPTQALPDDIFYIERKVRQDRTMIEYEMASAMDLMGQKLPARLITTNVCQWEYRRRNAANTAWEYPAYGCPYTGATMYTTDGIVTSDPLEDVCSKDLNTGCKKRYPNTIDILPFGGFPGSKAYKF